MRPISPKRRSWKTIALICIVCMPLAMTDAWAVGSIGGTVLENLENAHGVGVALPNANGVSIELTSLDGTVVATQSANGAFQFNGLAAGEYLLTVYDRERRPATATVSVADRINTTANVLLVARKRSAFIYFAAVGVEAGKAGNPDVTRDGLVTNSDLAAVTQGVNQDATENLLDVNRDGAIDDKDIALVRAAFGKVVVNIGSHYQAQVTPAGSIAVIGDGVASVQSESGSSTGIVDWAPAVTSGASREANPSVENVVIRPVNKNRVRFQITEDVGGASSPEIGQFKFSHNESDPTWIDVSLTTGRVTGGRIGLTLNGDVFGHPVNIAGNVADGVIAFAPGGFALYHLVNVSGTLPKDFPVLAEQAFVMEKCEPAKKSKECDSVDAQGVSCKWPITGKTGHCVLGFKCRTEGAACVLSGSCNTCQTQCRAGGGCDCWCLP